MICLLVVPFTVYGYMYRIRDYRGCYKYIPFALYSFRDFHIFFKRTYQIERIWLTIKARWFNHHVCKNEEQFLLFGHTTHYKAGCIEIPVGIILVFLIVLIRRIGVDADKGVATGRIHRLKCCGAVDVTLIRFKECQ